MDNKKKILIITILLVMIAIIGGTFAWWTWTSSTNTLVNFTVNPDFSCSVDGGGDITNVDAFIIPTDECTNTENAIVRKITTNVTNTSSYDVSMDLWLDVNEMGTGLSDSENFRYALTTSPTSCVTGQISSGTFNGKTKGTKVSLLDGVTFTGSSTGEYYLYIWLDSAETSTSTMNQTFQLSLNGSCTNDNEISQLFNITYNDGKSFTGPLSGTTTADDGISRSISINTNEGYSITGTGDINLNINTKHRLVGYVSAHCENSSTLETINDYTTQTDCESGGYTWVVGGSPLKYKVVDSTGTILNVGNIVYTDYLYNEDGHIIGDINSDGVLDDTDPNLLLEYINNLTDLDIDSTITEIDGNEGLTANDAMQLMRYINKIAPIVPDNQVTLNIPLYSGFNINNNVNTYTIYLWMDEHLIDDKYNNIGFSGEIEVNITKNE